MVKNNLNLSIFLVTFLFVVALCSANGNPAMRGKKDGESWCVADTGATRDKMRAFLHNGCSKYNCSAIQPGGSCFKPDILMAHTSWLLDLFYRDHGFCKDGLGFVTTTNPSHGDCTFP